MKPATLQPLVSLLQSLAAEAVSTQQRLDSFWETSALAHVLSAPGAGSPARSEFPPLHRALTPTRLVARRVEFTVGVHIERSRHTAFEIKVVPVNLSFAARHRQQVATSGRIRFAVEAVPLAARDETT